MAFPIRPRPLTGRGVVAALAVGAATVYGVGWRGLLVLLAFFISGSLLSKKARRNERQVLANGGVAAVAALTRNWVWFAGAIAAANADTWATEIGSHSQVPPRLITSGRPVPAGTDGGMTLLGTAGGIAGAAFIGGLSFVCGHRAFSAVAGAGVAGMLLDSLLGATVQGKVGWMDNDAVNLAATVTGAVCAGLLA
ncbi:MAG TPA: DUF92 domain-containing protein [Gemmatimonadales bacterium]|nr:DUF92 domain-containing protein [Gemmatimonadales bacterium]